MEAERLLLRKLDELEQRLASDDVYDTIAAATILYQVLLDGLLVQANVQTRSAVTWRVWPEMQSNGCFRWRDRGVDPWPDDFLDVAANSLGGKHSGAPTRSKDKRLQVLYETAEAWLW